MIIIYIIKFTLAKLISKDNAVKTESSNNPNNKNKYVINELLTLQFSHDITPK